MLDFVFLVVYRKSKNALEELEMSCWQAHMKSKDKITKSCKGNLQSPQIYRGKPPVKPLRLSWTKTMRLLGLRVSKYKQTLVLDGDITSSVRSGSPRTSCILDHPSPKLSCISSRSSLFTISIPKLMFSKTICVGEFKGTSWKILDWNNRISNWYALNSKQTICDCNYQCTSSSNW